LQQSIESIIKAKYGELSDLQKKIANVFMTDSFQLAFLTITELGKRVRASEASLTRFARSLGFKGYSELQHMLQEEVRKNLTPQEKMRQSLKQYDGNSSHSLKRIFAEEAEKIKQGYEEVDEESFQRAVDTVVRSQKVYIMGQGISVAIVDFLQFRFRRMGFDVSALTDGGSSSMENLLALTPEDTLIAIGFFRMYPEVVAALEFAKKVGARSIGITEDRHTLIAKNSDTALLAPRGSVSQLNSLALPMALVHAFAMRVAVNRKDEVLDMMEKLQWMNGKLPTKITVEGD